MSVIPVDSAPVEIKSSEAKEPGLRLWELLSLVVRRAVKTFEIAMTEN